MSAKAMDPKRQAIFETAPVPKAILTLAVPTVISQLITLAYNLADSFFVGRTGNPHMVAAVALVYPIFSMTTAFANLFGIGGGSLISRLLGAKRPEQARQVCVFSFYGAIAASALFSLAIFLFLDPILYAVGASPDTIEYAREYMLWILVLGGVPTVLSAVQAHLVRNVGYARQASVGLGLGAVLNIILDPLFMFVILPEGKEVIGAAVATMLSNLIATLYFVWVILGLRDKTVLSLNPARGLPERRNILSVLSVGLPSALTILFYDMTNVTLNALMSAYGDFQVAALGIVLKAERIPLNTGVGLCQGVMPLISYNYSAGSHDRMDSVIRTARVWGLIVAGASILFYELFAGPVIQVFMSVSAGDAAAALETVAYGTFFLRLRCLASPFAFLCFHTTYTLQAMGEGRATLFISTLRQLVIYIPIMFLMDSLFQTTGLVISQTVAEIISMFLAFYVFSRIRAKKRAELAAAPKGA